MYKFSESIGFGGFKEREAITDLDPWVVVNLSPREYENDDYYIPLNDGAYDGGNTQQEFAEAVNAVRKHLESDDQVFVHCAVGQSRSISVLATALAAEHGETYENMRDELMNIRNSFGKPANSLESKAEIYLRHI